MKTALKTITAIVCLAAFFVVFASVFGSGRMRVSASPSITAFARGVPLALPAAEESASLEEDAAAEESSEEYLLPYPQIPGMFSDMDMQYAYLILQQGLEKSFLKGNAVLSLENGNEFVIKCWSKGMGLDITEGLADNETRLQQWDDTVNMLWELDAVLSRDIKETLGTDKSVTFQIVDDVNPDAVLLKIKNGCIEYNLFRDGTSPEYEVYRGY